jgi:hypothetical protein
MHILQNVLMNYYSSILGIFTRQNSLKRNKISTDFLFLSTIVVLFSLQTAASIVLSYIASFVYLLKTKSLTNANKFIVVYWLIFSTSVSICIFQFNHGITPIFYLFFTPFILLSAKKIANKNIEHIENVITCSYVFFVCVILVGLILNFEKPDPIAHIIPWASQNGITSNLIVIHISYSIIYYLKKNKLPILLTVILVIICFYGLGRGSIIISVTILLISLFINYLSTEKTFGKNLLIILAFFVIIYLIYKQYIAYESEIDLLIERSKFSQNLSDDPRKDMLNEYLKKLNLWSIFFGSSFEGTSILKYYDGNPHNSYIRVHSFYGLIGLFSIFLPFGLIFFKKTNLKSKLIVSLFVIILLIRAFSEPILFPTTLDFFYCFNFFVFSSHSKYIKNIL